MVFDARFGKADAAARAISAFVLPELAAWPCRFLNEREDATLLQDTDPLTGGAHFHDLRPAIAVHGESDWPRKRSSAGLFIQVDSLSHTGADVRYTSDGAQTGPSR